MTYLRKSWNNGVSELWSLLSSCRIDVSTPGEPEQNTTQGDTMNIEFTCGKIVENVGMPGMAITAHMGKCDNADCQNALPAEAEKYKNHMAFL